MSERLRRRALTACALLAFASACEREPKPLVARAEFGVFFGGQLQERDEIPFELDRARQSQGFRVELSEPATRPLRLTWQLDRPAAARAAAGGRRSTEVRELQVRAGQQRVEQRIALEPGDALGIWNLRVLVEDEIAIDRRFLVYDTAARARAVRSDAGP